MYSTLNKCPQVLEKRRHLCVTDYDESYFDFHCLPKPPGHHVSWYTICGTPFANRAEYVAVIGAICVLAFNVFRTLHWGAGNEVVTKQLLLPRVPPKSPHGKKRQ